MNKIILNICLILVTCALLYTILTLPATINQTVRIKTEALMTSLQGDISQSVSQKADELTDELGKALLEEMKSKLQEVLPEKMDEEELHALIRDIATEVLTQNGEVISQEMISQAIMQVLRECFTQPAA